MAKNKTKKIEYVWIISCGLWTEKKEVMERGCGYVSLKGSIINNNWRNPIYKRKIVQEHKTFQTEQEALNKLQDDRITNLENRKWWQ